MPLFTPQEPRVQWVLSWPGQVVIAGCQVFWTTEVSEALELGDLADSLYPQLQTQVWYLTRKYLNETKHFTYPQLLKNIMYCVFYRISEHGITFGFLFVQLGDLVQLVRGGLSKMQRAVLSALIVIEVHAKDVAAKLVEQEVSSVNDFEWISQLRFVLICDSFLLFTFVVPDLAANT